MLQRFLHFLAPLLLSLPMHGQSIEGFYAPVGLGYAYQTVKDNSLSPVSYSGHLGKFNLGFYRQNSKWLMQLDLTGMGANQYPDVETPSITRETLTGLARAHYFLSRKVYDRGQWHLYVGLALHNLGDYRNHNRYGNSQDNYAVMFSAGPIAILQRDLSLWNRNFSVQYALALPAGTYYLRPGYVKPYTNDNIGAQDFAWWGDFFIIDSRTDFIWILSNKNQIRLSYIWEYAQLDAPNKVQLASHQLTISTVFKF